MRKLFTLLTISGFTFVASAQMVQSAKATLRLPTREDMSLSPVYAGVSNNNHKANTYNKKSSAWSGRTINTMIGTTMWSNQTNGAIYRRIISYKTGKISATWTAAFSGPADGYLTRGTGYNSMDGNSWGAIPQSRIESSYRTGFPNIATAPDGSEIILCHLADTGSLSGGFSLSTGAFGGALWSTAKVTGSTPPTGYPGSLWAHTAISGDYMVVVSNYTDSSGPTVPHHVFVNGVQAPMVYSRYQISTKTWVTINAALPGYDSTLYTTGSADSYSIDAKDNVVAIVAAKPFDDWAMWKSSDNGATWSKKVIMNFPVHKYDFVSDTLTHTICAGDAVHVLIDNSYNVHAFTDRADVSVDQTTQQTNITSHSKGYLYYYSNFAGIGAAGDAIFYWDESLATDSVKIIASSVKVNPPVALTDSVYSFAQGNGKWYGISNSTWPSVAIDSAGTMYLVYSSFTLNDDDGAGNYFRDIYVTYSTDNGTSWSNPVNVTAGLGFNVEQIYPSVARYADANIHITYLGKQHPGNDQNSASPEVYNIYDLSVSTADIKSNTTGSINGVNELNNNVFSLDQNFPNPFRGITTVPVKLNFSTDVTINIVNLVGQNMYSHKFEKAASGINNFQVDLSNLKSGVYFYTVEAEGYKITKRMMVE